MNDNQGKQTAKSYPQRLQILELEMEYNMSIVIIF